MYDGEQLHKVSRVPNPVISAWALVLARIWAAGYIADMLTRYVSSCASRILRFVHSPACM